jgi:hypothetical protein
MRRGIVGLSLLGAVACTFGSAGQGASAGLPNDGTESGEPSSGDDGAATSGDPADGDGSGADGDDDDGPDDGDPSDDDADDDGTAAAAALEFVEGSPVELGKVELKAGTLVTLTLRNAGDTEATAIAARPIDAPLAWEGGAYPGTTGTCGDALPADATCELVLVVLPGIPGISARAIGLDYDDGSGAAEVMTEVRLVGVGETANLLLNPGFEDSAPGAAPTEWNIGAGNWIVDTATAHEGVQSVHPGDGGPEEVTLYQEVEVGGYAATLGELGLGVTVTGYGVAEGTNNEPFNFRVRIFDDTDTEVGAPTESGFVDPTEWTPWTAALALPKTAATVRLELQCRRGMFATNCDAAFDALDLRFVYPPPS